MLFPQQASPPLFCFRFHSAFVFCFIMQECYLLSLEQWNDCKIFTWWNKCYLLRAQRPWSPSPWRVQRSLWGIKYTWYIGKRGANYILPRCAEWNYVAMSDTSAVSHSIVNFHSAAPRRYRASIPKYGIIFHILSSSSAFFCHFQVAFFNVWNNTFSYRE